MIIKSIIKFCCCWLKYALFYSITLSFHNYFFHFLQMMYSSIKRASKLKFKNKNKTAAEFTQQTVYHATLLKDKTSWNTLCSMRADGKRYCFSRNSHNHGRHSSKPILTYYWRQFLSKLPRWHQHIYNACAQNRNKTGHH